MNTTSDIQQPAFSLLELKRPLSKREVADWFGVHVSTIEEAVKRGDLRQRKLGYFVRFLAEDLRAWLDSGGSAPARATGRPRKNKSEPSCPAAEEAK